MDGSCRNLVGDPQGAGLRDPLAGMDAGVEPDGRALGASGAELGNQTGALQTLTPPSQGHPIITDWGAPGLCCLSFHPGVFRGVCRTFRTYRGRFS